MEVNVIQLGPGPKVVIPLAEYERLKAPEAKAKDWEAKHEADTTWLQEKWQKAETEVQHLKQKLDQRPVAILVGGKPLSYWQECEAKRQEYALENVALQEDNRKFHQQAEQQEVRIKGLVAGHKRWMETAFQRLDALLALERDFKKLQVENVRLLEEKQLVEELEHRRIFRFLFDEGGFAMQAWIGGSDAMCEMIQSAFTLGRLVQKMPQGGCLQLTPSQTWLYTHPLRDGRSHSLTYQETPEQALRQGGVT
jgi:hypothetical protein